MAAKKTTASRTKGTKTVAKKGVARKTTTQKATTKKNSPKRVPSKAAPRTSSRSATPVSSKGATKARRGDLIVIDSPQVGSPAREGEILKVIVGELSVRYQVRWGDGHETLISPVAGTARIVRT